MKRIVEAYDALDRFGVEGMPHAKRVLKEIIDAGEKAGRPADCCLCGKVSAERGHKPGAVGRPVKKRSKVVEGK